MELLVLASGRFKVTAPLEGEKCPVLDALANAPSHMSGHARGFKALFDQYAASGSGGLTAEQFHDAGGDGVFRFRKGKLRVYCFKDDDNLVVLTHAATKKSQKTSPSELTRANAEKQKYLDAKAGNTLSIKED